MIPVVIPSSARTDKCKEIFLKTPGSRVEGGYWMSGLYECNVDAKRISPKPFSAASFATNPVLDLSAYYWIVVGCAY